MSRVKRNNFIWLPPARVITLILMMGFMLGAIFWAMLGNWFGMVLGAAFAAAFYFIVVVNSRRSVKNMKKRRR
jgi:uncharacterized membrane protein YoaK (UPF0700 family)